MAASEHAFVQRGNGRFSKPTEQPTPMSRDKLNSLKLSLLRPARWEGAQP